jgi:hypothetical protein
MKANLELLNQSFERIKLNPFGYDTGSITPRTTTNKVICDEVKISPEALELYQKNISERVEKKVLILSNDREQELKKIALLKELLSIDKSDKLFDQKLQDVGQKVNLAEEQIVTLKSSFGIQIKHDSGFSFETIYQEGIRENKGIINTAIPAVIRYGLNTESKELNSLVGSYIEKGVLHPYEEALFQRAFDYLKLVESADYYIQSGDKSEYPNNVVLVDIFDRSKGFVNGGHNQTHTIALWKKRDTELVLIDPSQKSYSDHLLDQIKLIFKNITTLSCNTLYGVAIYKDNEDTGYSDYHDKKPKPRDCVDIAVKVGFELNEQQKLQNTLLKVESSMLAQISNDVKNAEYLGKFKVVVVRELQSSVHETRISAYRTLNNLNTGLMDDIVQKIKIRTDKIKNYQDIQKLEPILMSLTTIKEYV